MPLAQLIAEANPAAVTVLVLLMGLGSGFLTMRWLMGDS
jgi:hypothetical protein